MNYDLDTLWKSMVKVVDPEGKTVGSGFFIREDGYIITCHHVICSLSALQIEYNDAKYLADWCEDLSKIAADIAILKIEISNVPKVRLSVPKDQIVSAMVYGFPADKEKQFRQGFNIDGVLEQSPPINTLSTYTNKYAKIPDGKAWNQKPDSNDSFLAYKIDAGVSSGISGGLVLESISGNAIGVIQASTSQVSYAIKWNNITEQLRKLKINPEDVSAFSTISIQNSVTSISAETKISHLPSKAYRELRGRNADLERIMSALLDNAGRRIISIDGIGGIGKTALAREIAGEALKNGFSDVVWLTAAEKAGCIQMTFDYVLDEIAKQLDVADLIKVEGDARLSQTRDILLQKKCLIVLDNMETAAEPQQEIAEKLYSIIGSSKALLTSRYRFKSSDKDIYSIHLGGVDKDTSFLLIKDTALEKNIPQVLNVDSSELEPIIDVVGSKDAGYSPLALKFMIGQLIAYNPDEIIKYMQSAQIHGSQHDLSYNREFEYFWSCIFEQSYRLLKPQEIKFMHFFTQALEPNLGTSRETRLRDAMRLTQDEFAAMRDHIWQISFLEIGHQNLQRQLYLHRLTFSYFSGVFSYLRQIKKRSKNDK